MQAHAATLPASQSTSQFGPSSQFGMIDLAQLDELARRLSSLVPPGLREGREELQQNFKSVLQAGLGKLDLVTREEFEVQRAVLARTRERLEALERDLSDLVGTQAGDTPARSTPQH